jgi:hypothetical protein
MGKSGLTPILQVGGVQEAITVPPPACEVETIPALLTPTVPGSDELQVKGRPVMVFPWVSTTVAVTVFPLPEVTLMELVVLPVTASAIDCTAQVVKSRGWLVTLLVPANSEVSPGVCAVTLACPVASPVTGALSVAIASVATSALTDCQAKVPTLAVMSNPRLSAVAW